MDVAVHIIESPSQEDYFEGRVLGEALERALELYEVPSTRRLVAHTAQFREAVRLAAAEHRRRWPAHVPVLHLACHGSSEDGIQLTNRRCVSWTKLAAILAEHGFTGRSWVCLSVCHGAMALLHIAAGPLSAVEAVIGTPAQPTFPEALVGFSTFYYRVRRGGLSLQDAVDAMKAASGHEEFYIGSPASAREMLLEAMSKAASIPAEPQEEGEG